MATEMSLRKKFVNLIFNFDKETTWNDKDRQTEIQTKKQRLISRNGGSNLKGALCRPFQSLTKDFGPIIWFGRVLNN